MGAKKAPSKVRSQQEYSIIALKNVKNNLFPAKLSIIPAERSTFDCQFLYFVLVLSVILHGKPSFLISSKNIVAQRPGIGKQKK